MKNSIKFVTRFSFIAILVLVADVLHSQTIIYVRADATCPGNGSSWATAYCHLQTALANATSGSQIWVKSGTYFPDQGVGQVSGNSSATFQLKNGVEIYGGFAGTETSLTQRDWETNETILSGDIGIPNIAFDNSIRVVTANLVNSTAVLDGFTITWGYFSGGSGNGSNLSITNASPQIRNSKIINGYAGLHGGGAWIANSSSPVFTNVHFSNNSSSFHGGAIGVRYSSHPSFFDCTFNDNFTTGHGGVMHCRDQSSATFDNCLFENNESGQTAGAIVIQFNSSGTITNSSFIGNHSGQGSGALHMNDGGNVVVDSCFFQNNTATTQSGAVGNRANSTSSITNSVFIGNTSTTFAGAVRNMENAVLTMENNVFIDNESGSNAGAVLYQQNGSGSIKNCVFINNTANGHGGGLALRSTNNVTVEDCYFEGNAGNSGGGIYVESSSINMNIGFVEVVENTSNLGGGISVTSNSNVQFTNLIVSGNEAINSGGGIYCSGSTIQIINGLISGNFSSIGGGISNISNGSFNTINSTIAGNKADNQGGGLYQSNANSLMRNTIVYSNEATTTGNEIANFGSASANLQYSCFKNGSNDINTGVTADANSTNGNPNFQNPISPSLAPTADGSYRLIEPSFAIDAGNNAFIQGIDIDLDGEDRIYNNIVDMGAYETGQQPCYDTVFVAICSLEVFLDVVLQQDTMLVENFLGNNGCDSIIYYFVEVLPVPEFEIEGNTIICSDSSTTLSASESFVQYAWSSGSISETITVSMPGQYSLQVTNSDGCTASDSVFIVQPEVISTSIELLNPLCYGAESGAISLIAEGGMGALSFLWSNSANVSNLEGLSSGEYSVTITDAAGCTTEASAALENPDSLVLSLFIDSVLLDTVFVEVEGGSAPYSFLWSTGDSVKNLPSPGYGVYTVTVTDANGCEKTSAIEIPAFPLELNLIFKEQVLCYGEAQGSILVNIVGGQEPYSILWNNEDTTLQINHLEAGYYSAIVIDAAGVEVMDTFYISQPDAITLTAEIEIITVFEPGTIAINVNGGVAPYSFQWSTGDTTDLVLVSEEGVYHVEIIDSNGCILTDSFFVEKFIAPLELELLQIEPVSCFSGTDGMLEIDVFGGIPPYSILWSTGDSNFIVSNLVAGEYQVTVTDLGGVTISDTFVITQPEPIGTSAEVTEITFFELGSIYVTVAGGVAPYTYLWNTGDTTEFLYVENEGIYFVEIIDSNGCLHTDSFVVEKFIPALEVNLISKEPAKCYSGAEGSISVAVSGGIAPYSFNWSNGSTDSVLVGLSSGEYILIVTDFAGNADTSSYFIGEPEPITFTTEVSHAFIIDDGAIQLSVEGGVSPYSVQWSTGDSTFTITNLAAGFYSAVVSDANGCTIAVEPIEVIRETADFYISGKVYNHTDMLTGINVSNVICGIESYLTNESGLYSFQLPFTDSGYVIHVEKDINVLNGITTLDAVLITQHILGVQPLSSPYNKIAADINGNGIIEIGDVLQLRSMIILLIDDFKNPFTGEKNNTSWRFVPADYVFVDSFPESPIVPGFPEYKHLTAASALEPITQDFIGVKIGDVNATASPVMLVSSGDAHYEQVYFRESTVLKTDQIQLQKGMSYSIPFHITDIHNLKGLQFALGWNQNAIKLKNATLNKKHNIGFNGLHIDYDRNKMLLSWVNIVDAEIQEEVLFTLDFIAQKDVLLSEILQLENEVLHAEAYLQNLQVSRIHLGFSENKKFSVDRLYPNPTSGKVYLELTAEENEEIEIIVFSSIGTILKRYHINGQSAGVLTHEIPESTFSGSGTYYVQVITGSALNVYSLIVNR